MKNTKPIIHTITHDKIYNYNQKYFENELVTAIINSVSLFVA